MRRSGSSGWRTGRGRRNDAPARPPGPQQSGRMLTFTGILARATEVFGSQRAAEQWLERPAMGLDQRRPIDLLATQAGVEIVERFPTRLHYGVHVTPLCPRA